MTPKSIAGFWPNNPPTQLPAGRLCSELKANPWNFSCSGFTGVEIRGSDQDAMKGRFRLGTRIAPILKGLGLLQSCLTQVIALQVIGREEAGMPSQLTRASGLPGCPFCGSNTRLWVTASGLFWEVCTDCRAGRAPANRTAGPGCAGQTPADPARSEALRRDARPDRKRGRSGVLNKSS